MSCKKCLALIICIGIMFMGTPVLAENTSYPKMGYVNANQVNNGVYVRSGPGTSYTPLTFKGNHILLYRGNYVQVDGASGNWYKISFVYHGNKYQGYMSADYITTFELDSDFEAYLNKQGFPESYKPYLRALYEAFDKKWTFKAYKTGLNWNEVVEMESTLGVSLVDGTDTTLRSTLAGAYDSSTGKWTAYEPGWYAASEETVAAYLDPRNYLIDGTVFAFEVLSGDITVTFEQLKKVLADCQWATDQIINEFIEAGKAANVSPIFLAVRARQELGTKPTENASGKDVNGTGTLYYNFFNIGAYGSSNPKEAGLVYASQTDENTGRPWDTTYKALLGGAKFIASQYIARGQDTLYLQKFNVTSNNTYVHQYMTNIRAPYYEGWRAYKNYKSLGMLDTNFTFVIPVYDNMPEEAYPEPTKVDQPEVVSYDYVQTLGLKLADANLSGIQEGTTANSMIEKIKNINPNAEVAIYDKNGNAISDGKIGTGSTITIKDASGTMTYTFILYGDVNGDGQIGATDLLYVKRHILNVAPLTGASKKAATLANGQIGATSLLVIKKHILGTELIKQQ